MNEIKVGLSPDGSGLALTAPSGHQLTISKLEQVGPVLERMLLAAQDQGAARGLGTTASPTQGMVDKWVAGGGIVKQIGRIGPKPPKAEIEALSLEALGLV